VRKATGHLRILRRPTGSGAHPLHPTRARTAIALGETQTEIAAATENHRSALESRWGDV